MYFLDADEGTDDDMNPENLDENEDAASEKRLSQFRSFHALLIYFGNLDTTFFNSIDIIVFLCMPI